MQERPVFLKQRANSCTLLGFFLYRASNGRRGNIPRKNISKLLTFRQEERVDYWILALLRMNCFCTFVFLGYFEIMQELF